VKYVISVPTDLAGGGSPLLEGDRVRPRHAILNLIANAVEAMSSGVRLTRQRLEGRAERRARRATRPGSQTGAATLDCLFRDFYTMKPAVWGWAVDPPFDN
jgi:signal transduction histidine kinase